MKLQFSFLPIPEEIMVSKAISDGAKVLFGIIAKANLEKIRFSIKYLSERMGCSPRETRNRIQELKKNNLVLVKRTGRSNIYQINFQLIHLVQEKEIGTGVPIKKAQGVPIREEHPVPIHNKEVSLKNPLKGSNEVAILRSYFIDQCKEIKGFEPEMAFGKEGKLLKEKIKRYSIDQLKDLIDKFLNSRIGEDIGYTLSICLSAGVINQWLAGKLEKPKKAYFQGNQMRKMFGKWQVLEGGDWLEFAGKESEIKWK